MKITNFEWKIGCSDDRFLQPVQWFSATVPGAAQADYAKSRKWPAFFENTNSSDYGKLEDLFWQYRTTLHFSLEKHEIAQLVFEGIDYRYEVRIDEEIIASGEGMFHPVICDISRFSGAVHDLFVTVFPSPKYDDSCTRSQASHCCKSPACYGWDWHPRLLTSGLWQAAYLRIFQENDIFELDVQSTVCEPFSHAEIRVKLAQNGKKPVKVRLYDTDVLVEELTLERGSGEVTFRIENPKLWQPVGFGEAFLYSVEAFPADAPAQAVRKKVGIRRIRLVMNEGAWRLMGMPKSRSAAPITLEVNGRRIFGKGTNWVNAQVFPGEMTEAHTETLLTQIKDANMNLVRVWGGGFVNPEYFYDICDRLGLLVWQEFPLACNEYPDDTDYLAVLEQEAVSVVRRLRHHPCIAIWCGGNELFNAWSGMTEQHHALRLLDSICYREDRNTPFLMTSPLFGMAHGSYVNYDEDEKQEFLTTLVHCEQTAYTEFGAPSMSSVDVLKTFMSQEDLQNCSEDNPVWRHHHAFGAWKEATWLRKPEAEYFFGGYSGTEDLCKKTQFIQAMCLRSYFEEMRRQWPHCSMALNWCFNEPWPTAANNSIVSFPAQPKPAYFAVKEALRAQMASVRVQRQLWWEGETFSAEIWMLNDSTEDAEDLFVRISYELAEEKHEWGVLGPIRCDAQRHTRCGSILFPIPIGCSGKIILHAEVDAHPEMDSHYTYLCRTHRPKNTAGMLNV